MTVLQTYPGQPYPTVDPWIDLRGYIESSWTMAGSAWHIRGLIDGNTAHLHIRTRRGTSSTLTESLPEEFRPAGQLILPAIVAHPDATGAATGLVIEPTGALRLYTPWQALADGRIDNLIVQGSYQRRAA